MKIGFIGLGKMGLNLAEYLTKKGYDILGYDIDSKIKSNKIKIISSLKELIVLLPKPQIIWLMLPSGDTTNKMVEQLSKLLDKKSIIIDSGNSYFLDTVENSKKLKKVKIHFIDCGTSGGIVGAKKGQLCMMVGGDKAIYNSLKPIFKDVCAHDGYGHFGKSGSGHYVKMVHNGIEYGMMASIAEGFQTLRNSELELNLQDISSVLKNGSIIESKLMDWLDNSLKDEHLFNKISGSVPKGETEDKMKQLSRSENMKILEQALKMRSNSRKKLSFSGKVISALRNQFGGHKIN